MLHPVRVYEYDKEELKRSWPSLAMALTEAPYDELFSFDGMRFSKHWLGRGNNAIVFYAQEQRYAEPDTAIEIVRRTLDVTVFHLSISEDGLVLDDTYTKLWPLSEHNFDDLAEALFAYTSVNRAFDLNAALVSARRLAVARLANPHEFEKWYVKERLSGSLEMSRAAMRACDTIDQIIGGIIK